MAGDGIEREIKLAVDPARAGEVFDLPTVAAGGGEAASRVLDNTYFDTPDLALQALGGGLRVRVIDGRARVQTLKLKAAGGGGGLHSYHEYEDPIGGDRPSLALLPDEARRALAGLDEAKLGPLFRTRFERRAKELDVKGGRVELAADRGVILAGVLEEPISEIEIELLEGDVAVLRDLAREIEAALGARPETRTKAHRGYDLARRAGLIVDA